MFVKMGASGKGRESHTILSISKSTEAVACRRGETQANSQRAKSGCKGFQMPLTSSMTITLLCLNRALAMAISCLSPLEKFFPSPVTTLSSPTFLLGRSSPDGDCDRNPTLSRTSRQSKSLCMPKGSRFWRIVPAKSVAFWVMNVRRDRRS